VAQEIGAAGIVANRIRSGIHTQAKQVTSMQSLFQPVQRLLLLIKNGMDLGNNFWTGQINGGNNRLAWVRPLTS